MRDKTCDKTCGNCDYSYACALMSIYRNRGCGYWQPIHVPKPMEQKTCGNCGNSARGDECMLHDWNTAGGTPCGDWQPIPADAPEPRRNATEEQKYQEHLSDELHEAIAKRDDLIRRMAEWMKMADIETRFWMRGKFHSLGDLRELISEANELLGVK